jgi:hypothetical protein
VTDDLGTALGAYGWLDSDDPRLSALSLTLVRSTPEKALASLRPTRSIDGTLTLAEAGEAMLAAFDRSRLAVQVDELDGWTALIEPFGWAGATPEVLARLSDGGRAVNVYWNVNALMHVGWADGGRLVQSFDPLLDDRIDGRTAEEADLPFGDPALALRAAFVLAERLTGVRIERDWLLDRRRPTAEIPVP